MQRFCWMATPVLALTLAGCGGDGLTRVAIQGKLTAKGKPVDNAVVQFIPMGSTKGEGGIARSDADGNFTMTGSRQGHRGVVPGDYKVVVSRMVAADGTVLGPDWKQAENPSAKDSIPEKYSSRDSSPLKVTVPETGGSVPVDIPEPLLGRK
jgi:hypothetical protein